MSNYKNEEELLKLIKSMNTISGEFEIKKVSDSLMDLDMTNRIFKDCTILGGDFSSSSFINCTFDNVLLKNLALFGVSFDNCNFVKCKFSNIQISFNMHNCQINNLTITQETE